MKHSPYLLSVILGLISCGGTTAVGPSGSPSPEQCPSETTSTQPPGDAADPAAANAHCRVPLQACDCQEDPFDDTNGGINMCEYKRLLCQIPRIYLYDNLEAMRAVKGRCDKVVELSFDDLPDGPLTEASVDGVRVSFSAALPACAPTVTPRPDGGKELVTCSATLGDFHLDFPAFHAKLGGVGIFVTRAKDEQVAVRPFQPAASGFWNLPMGIDLKADEMESLDAYTAVSSFAPGVSSGFVGMLPVEPYDSPERLQLGSAATCSSDPPLPSPIRLRKIVLCVF